MSDLPERTATARIAVIGIGCRFPGDAEGPDAFWELLRDGVDATREMPDERWDVDAHYDPEPGTQGKYYTRRGGFFERSATEFDAAFFAVSAAQANYMDPQERMNLEAAWHAVEDAGISLHDLRESNTGVFVGATASSYQTIADNDPMLASAHSILGVNPGANAGLISHHLALRGPSFAVDTACSSSLVALHQACKSLRDGECDLALAGGANTMVDGALFVSFCAAHMLSPDGRCKTFDASADGYARGEGCGIVLLERLDDALANGRRILGVIRGSAVNHGTGGALTAPSGPAQQTCIRNAVEAAGVDPADVTYVEAHGTGTPVGDPIEFHALKAVYAAPRDQPLYVGSVKTNIGHLEVASGMAGLIKVLLALRHRQIPPHLHFERWNPQIDREGFDADIPTSLVDWESEGPRIAAISSFGFQGTNAHVIVEEAPERAPRSVSSPPERPWHLLALSGKSDAAVRALAQRHRDALAHETVPLGDHLHTANVGRAHLERRAVVIGPSRDALREGLDRLAKGGGGLGARPRGGARPVTFLFTGQGSQHEGMGRSLYDTLPVYRRALDECAALLADEALLAVPLLDVLWGEHADRLDETAWTQPALFSLQRALYETWTAWGIEPAAVVGHSIGEYMAAVAAGMVSWQDALRLVVARGELMQSLDRRAGAMGAVGAGEADVAEAVQRLDLADVVGLAGINGPSSVVVSGDSDGVGQILAHFEAQGARTRRLSVSHAFHSHLMDPILDAFEAEASRVAWTAPRVPFCSTLTGELLDEGAFDATYWRRQIREPVRYHEALRTLVEAGRRHFLELGPQPHLTAMAQGCLSPEEQDECLFAASLRGPARGPVRVDDWQAMLGALGDLYAFAGHTPDFAALDDGYPERRPAPVPSYPYQRERFWHPLPERERRDTGSALVGLLGERVRVPGVRARIHDGLVGPDTPDYLADHVVGDTTLLPAAGFLDMALSAARRALGEDDAALELAEVRFTRMLSLGEGPRRVRIVLEPERGGYAFEILSAPPDQADDLDAWTPHVVGEVRAHRDAEPRDADMRALFERMDPNTLTRAEIYERLGTAALQYGPRFQGVAQVWRGEGEALGRVDLTVLERTLEEHYVYPPILDSAFHVVAAAVARGAGTATYLPVRVERATFDAPVGSGPFWVHVQLTSPVAPQRPVVADLTLHDRRGTRLARVGGLVLAPVSRARLRAMVRGETHERAAARWAHHVAWLPQARAEVGPGLYDERFFVLGSSETAQAFVAALATASLRVSPIDVDGLEPLMEKAWASGAGRLRVVQFLDGPPAEALQRDAFDVVHAVATFRARHAEAGLSLTLVTRGAQATDPAIEAGMPLRSANHALYRVARQELPGIDLSTIDLDPARQRAEDDPEALLDELNAIPREPEVAYRGAQRLVRRVTPLQAGRSASLGRPAVAAGPMRLAFTARGSIDNLRVLESQPTTRVEPGWVRVRVHAAGLNFRDVMNVLGTYPGDPGAMGLECTGVVVDVGAGVTDFAPGDRVVGLISGCFDGDVVVPGPLLAHLPDAVSFEGGATLPVTFITAHYALNRLAKVQPGERVLIHAGTGGVGMAAIQLAKRAGAEIFSTAGARWKRDLLPTLGVDHVFHSRTLDFHDQILEVTDGEGIDVALNSIAGPFIPKTVELLREGGRYLEIGKTGIWTEEQIRAHNPDATGHLIALDTLTAERPDHVGEMLREIVQWVGEGSLSPLPVTRFPIEGARRAFRYMIKARHTGKNVLTGFQPRPIGREEGTYVITGGLGALGLHTARWLREQGAGKVVLLGRSAPSDAAAAEVDALAASGPVEVASIDVTDRDAMADLLGRLRAEGPPIRGIVHAAGVLDDGFLANQTWERIRAVAAPKVLGAAHLDALTREDPLDFFLLYSSMAAVLGNVGQAGYAMGNAYLDALAHHRRAHGRTALSVDWGPWSTGMAARLDDSLKAQQEALGIEDIDPERGFEVLGEAMERDEIQVAVLPIDWSSYIDGMYAGTAPPLLADVRDGAAEAGGDEGASTEMDPTLRGQLQAAASDEERLVVWREFLRMELATLLGMEADPGVIQSDLDLEELGVDSLVGMELLKRFNDRLGDGNRVSTAILFRHRSIDALARYLDGTVGPDDRERRVQVRSPVPRSLQALREELPGAGLEPAPQSDEAWPCRRVLLTGATGVVGSRLLLEWLRRYDGEVICLVRGQTPRDALRRVRRFVEVYGPVDGLGFEERVRAVPGDLAVEHFGWSEPTWRALTAEVDAVVHVGAITSLVAAHAKLEAVNVGGTAAAAEFALATRSRAMLHVSSYSIFGSAIREPGPDLDETRLDVGQEHHIGYTRSKLESEEVVRRLGARGLRWRIARLGDVLGDSDTGHYPFDLLGESSLYVQLLQLYRRVGAYPAFGVFWPVAVDDVARALCHLATGETRRSTAYHLFHDRACRVDELEERWIRAIGPVERVDLAAFLERVERWGNAKEQVLTELLFGPLRGLTEVPDRLRSATTWARLAEAGVRAPAGAPQTVERFVDGAAETGTLGGGG